MGRKGVSLPVEVCQVNRRQEGWISHSDNPYSDVWLDWQKSAEAIVPARGRAEHQEVPETKRIREKCRESRQLHGDMKAGRRKQGWNPEIRRER